TLPLGRPFITACLGGAIGGAFQAVMYTAAKGIGVSGLSLIPLIDDGKYVTYFFGLMISYGAGYLFTYLFGFREEMANNISGRRGEDASLLDMQRSIYRYLLLWSVVFR